MFQGTQSLKEEVFALINQAIYLSNQGKIQEALLFLDQASFMHPFCEWIYNTALIIASMKEQSNVSFYDALLIIKPLYWTVTDRCFSQIQKLDQHYIIAAIEMLQATNKRFPKRLIIIYWISQLEYSIGNQEKAFFWCNKGLEMKQQHLPLTFIRGLLEQRLGKYQKAIRYMKIILRERPDHIQCLTKILGMLQHLSQKQQEYQWIKRMLWMYPTQDYFRLLLLKFIYRQLKPTILQPMLNRFKNSNPKNHQFQFWSTLGDMLNDRKELLAAKDCYERAIETNQAILNAQSSLCELNLKMGKNTDAICSYLKKAVEIRPTINKATRIHTLIRLALIFLKINRMQQALNCCRTVNRIQPQNAEAYAIISYILVDSSKEMAFSYLQKAMSFLPDVQLWGVLQNLIENVMEYMDQPWLERCTEYFLKAVKSIQQSVSHLIGLGNILMMRSEQGQHMIHSAYKVFWKALTLQPDNLSVLINLVALQIRQDNFQQAIKKLDLIIQLSQPSIIQYSTILRHLSDCSQIIIEQYQQLIHLNILPCKRTNILTAFAQTFVQKQQYIKTVIYLRAIDWEKSIIHKLPLSKIEISRLQASILDLQANTQQLLIQSLYECKMSIAYNCHSQNPLEKQSNYLQHLFQYLQVRNADLLLLLQTRFYFLETQLLTIKEQQKNKLKSFQNFCKEYSLYFMIILLDTPKYIGRSKELLVEWAEKIFLERQELSKAELLQSIINSCIQALEMFQSDKMENNTKSFVHKCLKNDYVYFRVTLLKSLPDINTSGNPSSQGFNPHSKKISGKSNLNKDNKTFLKKRKKRVNKSSKRNQLNRMKQQQKSKGQSQFFIYQKQRIFLDAKYQRSLAQKNIQKEYLQPLLAEIQITLVNNDEKKPGDVECNYSKDKDYFQYLHKKNIRSSYHQSMVLSIIRLVQKEMKSLETRNIFESLQELLQRMLATSNCKENTILPQVKVFLLGAQQPESYFQENVILARKKKKVRRQALNMTQNLEYRTIYKTYDLIRKLLKIFPAEQSQSDDESVESSQSSQSQKEQAVLPDKQIQDISNKQKILSSDGDYENNSRMTLQLVSQETGSRGVYDITQPSKDYHNITFALKPQNKQQKEIKVFINCKAQIRDQVIQLQIKNHVYFARYLSTKRKEFQYIAKHYFDEQKLVRHHQLKAYLAYELKVEKGDVIENVHQLWEGGRYQVFQWIICVIKGILQLQAAGIFNPDLGIRNTIRSKSDKHHFKLIDFDFAFKVEVAREESHRSLFLHTKDILRFWLDNDFSNNDFIEDYLFKNHCLYQGSNDPSEQVYTVKTANLSQDQKVELLLEKIQKYSLLYHRDQLQSILDDIFQDKKCDLDPQTVRLIKDRVALVDPSVKQQNMKDYQNVLEMFRQCGCD